MPNSIVEMTIAWCLSIFSKAPLSPIYIKSHFILIIPLYWKYSAGILLNDPLPWTYPIGETWPGIMVVLKGGRSSMTSSRPTGIDRTRHLLPDYPSSPESGIFWKKKKSCSRGNPVQLASGFFFFFLSFGRWPLSWSHELFYLGTLNSIH